MLLDDVGAHEASALCPALRWVVEHVINLEVVVLLRQLIQLFAENDVVWIHVGVNEGDLCLVFWILEDRTDDLETWCDSRSACNHAKGTDETGSVVHLAFGTLDFDRLMNLHLPEVFRDEAGRVRFDDEVKVSSIVVRGRRCVRSSYLLAVNVACDCDVLADGKPENMILRRECESVEGRVGANWCFLDKLEFLVDVLLQNGDCPAAIEFSGNEERDEADRI